MQTKEEELLNQIIQESGSEEEGNIYEEDLQQVLEHVRSVGTKRKREEQNPVFAVEKFIDETSTADTGNWILPTDRVFALSMTGPKGKDPAGGFNGEIVVDTGNTAGLLVPQGYSTLLENRKPSKMRCTSASGDRMQIGEDGKLPIHVTTEGGHVNFDLPLKLALN